MSKFFTTLLLEGSRDQHFSQVRLVYSR